MIGDSFLPPSGDFAQSPKQPHFVQMNGRCPVCSNTFDYKRLHILFEQNGASLLHITCQNCHSSTLASVVVGASGVNFSGIVTDLNITDVLKFKDNDEIASDYVMDLHEALKQDTLDL